MLGVEKKELGYFIDVLTVSRKEVGRINFIGI